MSNLDNVKIKTKIIASFVILLFMTIGIGGLAVNRLAAVDTAAGIIRNNYLPSLSRLGQIVEDFELYRIRNAQELISMAQGDSEKWIAESKKNLEKLLEERKGFEPYIDDGEERERWITFDKRLIEYNAELAKLDTLIRADKAQEAAVTFQGNMRLIYQDMRKILMDELTYNEEHGKAQALHGAEIYQTTRLIMFIAIGFALMLSLVCGSVLISSVSKPVVKMADAMGRLANGDLDITVTGSERQDEIGLLARAMSIFKENALKNRAMEADKAEAQKAREARALRIEELNAGFDKMASEALNMLASAATELNSTASSMSESAASASSQSSAVAAASEEASANVQAVASAAEQLTASISEISRQVSQSSTIAGQAVVEATQTNETVANLAQAAQKIGEVVGLISDIASQTNLLALNATIEAARAGEAGKGFAVVASEVKSLANQTAKATEDISAQVGTMQSAMQSAVTAIDRIGKTISHMNDISASVAAAVEEQGSATKEITRNVSEAAQGTTDVSRNIVGVNQATDETGHAAGQVLEAASELSKQTEILRSNVRGFLDNIRKA